MAVDRGPGNPAAARIGPIVLAPGITRGNAFTLLAGMFCAGIVIPYLNFAQPYILTEHLGIPRDRQGAVSGDLAFWTEVILIALSGIMGAWSDRAGRRLVFALGLAVVAAAYVFYPLAGSYDELLLYRIVYAVGIAAMGVMSVAVQAEYPAEESRGKLVAAIAILSILGVLFVVAVLAPLPARFTGAGASPVEAGRRAYWVTAGIALAGGLLVWSGLARRIPAPEGGPSFMQRLRIGLTAARDNPRIALGYAAAFIGRTDLVVVVVFLSLWITQAGRAQGMTTQAALIQAAIMFGVLQGAALLFAPVMGLLTDRVNRVVALAIATGLALAGYLWMGLLDQPMGPGAFPAAVVLGMGQVAAILAATALIGQEAEPRAVGAISGVFTLSGAIGILLATKLGGWIYDAWMPGAPFVITGLLNGVVMVAALAVVAAGLHRRPEPADTPRPA